MPAYPYPNWIQPPDIAAEFARGAQLGQEQARMQMQAEENQRSHLMEQQRLEVDRAYKEQQLAMDKQQLDQATKLNQLKIQDAAQQLDAQKKYQAFVDAGGDPAQGLLKYGMAGGSSLAGYAGILKDINLSRLGPTPASPIGKLQFDRKQALARGDTDSIKAIDAAIQNTISKENKTENEPSFSQKKEIEDAYKELDAARKDYDASTDAQSQANNSFKVQAALSRIKAATTTAPKARLPLTKELAKQFLSQAKGDKEKARQLAKDAGYDF